jgi:pyruvate dehydrogenase E1 component
MFKELLAGTGRRGRSTTMAFVRVLRTLLKDKKRSASTSCRSFPDEARTFGMESLFRQYGIYASQGQLYKPVDSDNAVLQGGEGRADSGRGHHRSRLDGVVHCRRTAYANVRRADDSVLHLLFDVRLPAHGRPDLGLRRFARQGLSDGRHGRPHDAGGRGLQHQDGHSPMLASTCRPAGYDPAYAYEIAVIVQDGIRRMYEEHEDCFYYMYDLQRELRACRRCRRGRARAILKGIYRYRSGGEGAGGGAAVRQRVDSATNRCARSRFLAEKYGIRPMCGA